MGENRFQNARFKVTAVQTTAGGFSDYRDRYAGEMVAVDGGSFERGSNRVSVSDFHIGKYEVTQAQWEAIMGLNPSHFSGCDNCPVEGVSWNDIQKYLERLNDRMGMNYRLPTEAEWEYAACGGSGSRTWF